MEGNLKTCKLRDNAKSFPMYQYALLAGLFFERDEIDSVLEDYEEYYENVRTKEKIESPWKFYYLFMKESGQIYSLNKRGLLVGLVGLLLISVSIFRIDYSTLSTQMLRLSILEIGISCAIWIGINGKSLIQYSPKWKCDKSYILFTFIPLVGIVLLVFWSIYFINVMKGEAIVYPNNIGEISKLILLCWMCICVVLFFASVYQIWQKSIWYFIPLTQTVSGWCFFRYVFSILKKIRVDHPQQMLLELQLCLLLLAIGVFISFIFLLIIGLGKKR